MKDNNELTIDDHWKRKAALFISGQAISLFGSSLVQYAIIWYITLNTKSGQMMMLISIFAFMPQILISLFAGVWADRLNRKKLIILSDILIASVTLVLAIIFLLGYRELWLLFVITGIRSFGAGIQTPAVNALIPQITPIENLAKVNGINGSVQTLTMLLSPAASGALLAVATIETVFFIDVVTAIIAVCIMLTLKVKTHKKASSDQKVGYLDDLMAGITYTREHKFVRSLLVFYSIFYFLVTPVAMLTPLMIARTFGEEVWRLTFNEMSYFGGSVIGGLLFTVWGGLKNRIHTMAFSCVLFGMMTAVLGLANTFAIYLLFVFLEGLGFPYFYTPATVLLQEKVDLDMQGRVFGMIQIVGSSAFPLGMMIFGPLADVIKIEVLLIITGVLMAMSGVSIFFNKGLNSV